MATMKYFRIKKAEDCFDRPAGEIVHQNQQSLEQLQTQVAGLIELVRTLSSSVHSHIIDLTGLNVGHQYPEATRSFWEQNCFTQNPSNNAVQINSNLRIATPVEIQIAALVVTLTSRRHVRELTADDGNVELPVKLYTIKEAVNYWNLGFPSIKVKPLKLWSRNARKYIMPKSKPLFGSGTKYRKWQLTIIYNNCIFFHHMVLDEL